MARLKPYCIGEPDGFIHEKNNHSSGIAKHAREIARVLVATKITLTEAEEDKQLQIALRRAAER